MDVPGLRLTAKDVLGYLLAYACWLVAAALSVLTMLQIRNALNTVLPALGANRWIVRTADRFSLLLLGLVALSYLIFLEHFYRSNIDIARNRRAKALLHPPPQMQDSRGNRVTKLLRREGLDVLGRRLVPTMAVPLALYAMGYLIQQLSLWSLTW